MIPGPGQPETSNLNDGKERFMTGYTVHTGASLKFTEGWDRIFSEGTSAGSVAGTSGSKRKTGQAAAAKTTEAAGKKAAVATKRKKS
jgi:hypothetical protein